MRGIGVQPCRQPISAIARKRDWISPQGESRLSESPSPCCRLLKKSATPPRLFIALSQVQGLRFPHFTVRWNERESDGCAVLIVCDPPDRLC